MFYSTTFAPAFERERRSKMMKQTFRKKVGRGNLAGWVLMVILSCL